MSIEQLDEVFDQDKVIDYPVINMNPKYKVPQVWNFKVPGNDFLMARLMQFTGKETVKQYKRGDKIAEVFLMSGTSHGHAVPLKGGLGDAPIDAIHLLFRTVWSSLKLAKPDVVLFRFPSKKMKGQEHAIHRIMTRLVQMNTGGRYRVLPNFAGLGKKNAFVIMYRKGVELLSVDGMPPVPDQYVKVETKVGEVYTNKDNGEQVSSQQIAAETLMQASNVKSDASVASRTKFNRRALAQAQYAQPEAVQPGWEAIDAAAEQFSKPADAQPITDSESLVVLTKPSELNANMRMNSADYIIRSNQVWTDDIPVEEAERVLKAMKRKFKKVPVGSLEQMQAFAEGVMDLLSFHKDRIWGKAYQNAPPNLSQKKYADDAWQTFQAKYLRTAVKDFAHDSSSSIEAFMAGLGDGSRFTAGQRHSISEYTGPYYSDINSYLLGTWSEDTADIIDDESAIISHISAMDGAFKTGQRLPADVTLWRGQRLRPSAFEAMKKTRLFYFRNYVSTSLMPIIFGGWQTNAAVALTHSDTRAELNVDKDEEIHISPHLVDDPENVVNIGLGWSIKGGDRINVIVPGMLSMNQSEMEVILPRGTILKVNKITDASYSIHGAGEHNYKMVEAEIQTNDMLSEGETVYDGDLFMETGELVAYSHGDAVSLETFKEEKVDGLGLLGALIDLGAIPEKFIL